MDCTITDKHSKGYPKSFPCSEQFKPPEGPVPFSTIDEIKTIFGKIASFISNANVANVSIVTRAIREYTFIYLIDIIKTYNNNVTHDKPKILYLQVYDGDDDAYYNTSPTYITYDIYNSISNKFKIININQFWNHFIHHNFANNPKYLISKTQFDNFVIGCLLINNHYCISLSYDVWVQIFSFIVKKDIYLYKKVLLR